MLERNGCSGSPEASLPEAARRRSYASRDNLSRAKAHGVRDMAFHKKGGRKIEDMVRSRWVDRQLRNFRAGIAAAIACLKRASGLARCPAARHALRLDRAPQNRLHRAAKCHQIPEKTIVYGCALAR
jgi:hypothetical protein